MLMSLGLQVAYLFLLAIPVACISWTLTHEELFKEPRDFCKRHSENTSSFIVKKFFYLFTCEYCFSHYVVVGMLFLTNYKFLFTDWRGYILAGFSLVWVANIYMSVFLLLRTEIKKIKTDTSE